MTTNHIGRPINYFLVSVSIIKNSKDIVTEEHGIKGKDTTPEHGFNSLRQKIKEHRKKNYPNDVHEIVFTHYDKISKDLYEAKFGQ